MKIKLVVMKKPNKKGGGFEEIKENLSIKDIKQKIGKGYTTLIFQGKSGNSIDDKYLKELCDALKGSKIEALEIPSYGDGSVINTFRREGAKDLCGLVKEAKFLKRLVLDGNTNMILTVFLYNLKESLKTREEKGPKLFLSLNNIELSENSVKYLNNLMTDQTHISGLSLNGVRKSYTNNSLKDFLNKFSEVGFAKSLESLSLANNKLGSEEQVSFVENLKKVKRPIKEISFAVQEKGTDEKHQVDKGDQTNNHLDEKAIKSVEESCALNIDMNTRVFVKNSQSKIGVIDGEKDKNKRFVALLSLTREEKNLPEKGKIKELNPFVGGASSKLYAVLITPISDQNAIEIIAQFL